MDNDNDRELDASKTLPFACVTADGILVGVLPDNIDYEDFTRNLTAGEYEAPGAIASFAICPGAVGHKYAGILVALQFPAPNGRDVERVEVGRIPYSALIKCMAAIIHGMQCMDLLKHEPGGDRLSDLLTAEQRARETLQ